MHITGKVKGFSFGFIAVFALLFLCLSSANAQTTAEQYVTNGENALFSETVDGILEAHEIFLEARTAYPGDPVISAYLALTRFLHLALTEDVGGLKELLAQFGITRTGHDLETLEFHAPEDADENPILPETSPSTETIRSFLAGPLLTTINASIADFDSTINNWTTPWKHVIPADKFDPGLGLEFDEGDIYLFRAGLKFMKAFILIITAYNLDVDTREIFALGNLDALDVNGLLSRYQELLNLLTTGGSPGYDGGAALAEARTTLIDAITDYTTASGLIRSDTNTAASAEELIEIDPCDLRREDWIRTNLTNLKSSLDGTGDPVFTLVEEEETWTFTDGGTGRRLEVRFWDNMSEGEFYGLDGCDFIACGGGVECIVIDGNQVSMKFWSWGDNWWSEATFIGTIDLNAGTITGGTYECTNENGSYDGTFTATRTAVEEETQRFNFNPVFGNGSGPYDFRDFLPLFNECDEPVVGTFGYGLNPSNPDATLGGILPDFTQEDWEEEEMPSGIFPMPTATIDVTDSVISDWGAIPPVFTDGTGEGYDDLPGSDLKDLYLAKDDQYLYVRMTLADGSPYTAVTSDPYYQYQSMHYTVRFSPNVWEDESGRVTGVSYNPFSSSWEVYAGPSGPYPWDYYKLGDAQAVGNDLEWRVPLNVIGNLSGRYITSWIHWSPSDRAPSDYSETCIRIGPMTTVSGTVTVPNHDGTGAMYVGVFRFDGNYNTDPENRFVLEIFYPDEYSQGDYTNGISYTVSDVPVGENVFVAAWWDADFNGAMTPGDYLYFSSVFTTQQTGNDGLNLGLTNGYPAFPAPRLNNVTIFKTTTSTGSQVLFVTFVEGPSPQDVMVTVNGPGGFYRVITPGIFHQPLGMPIYFVAVDAASVPDGNYRFRAVDSRGRSDEADFYFWTMTPPPLADRSTFTPIHQGYVNTTTPTLSWSPVSGAAAYKAYVMNWKGDVFCWISPPSPDTQAQVPAGLLQSNTPYKWFVRAYTDSYSLTNCSQSDQGYFFTGARQTPSFGPAFVIDLPVGPELENWWNGFVARVNGVAPWSISSLKATGPDTTEYFFGSASQKEVQTRLYSPPFYTWANPTASPLPDGIYTFEVQAIGDPSAVTRVVSYTHDPLETVDEATMSPAANAYFDTTRPSFSWDPVSSTNVQYTLRIYDALGTAIILNETFKNTSYRVPAGVLKPGGSYQWRVQVSDYDPVNVTQMNATFTANRRFTILPTVPTASINGTINYSGEQTGQVRIELRSAYEDEDTDMEELSIPGPGPFTFSDVPEGTYYLVAWLDVDNDWEYSSTEPYGHYRSTWGLREIVVRPGEAVWDIEVTLEAPVGDTGISGTVNSSLSADVNGYILLWRAGDWEYESDSPFVPALDNIRNPVTGADLTLTPGSTPYQVLEDDWDELPVPAGTYDVYFMTGDLEEGPGSGVIHGMRKGVRVERGVVTPNVDFSLSPGASLSGTVTSNAASPLPIPGATVALLTGSSGNYTLAAFAIANHLGNYHFENVPVGSYTLLVQAKGFDTTQDSVTFASPGDVLQKGLTVVSSTGYGSITVKVMDDAGGTILSPTRAYLLADDEPVAGAAGDASGNVSLQSVLPGEYKLVASARGYHPWSREISVQGGNSLNFSFYLYPMTSAITRGVEWLLAQQNPDGSFGPQQDQYIFGWSGYAALALLSIKENSSLGLSSSLLSRIQNSLDDETGADGKVGVKQYFLSHYHDTAELNNQWGQSWTDVGAFYDNYTSWAVVAATPVALERLIALGLPIDDPKVLNSVNFLKLTQLTELTARHPDFIGGWRYNPYNDDADAWESPWVIMALMKAGVSPTEPHVVAGLDFLRRCRNTEGANAGTFKYMPGEEGFSAATTAASIVAMGFAGLPRTAPEIADFFTACENHPHEVHHNYGPASDAYYWSMLAWAASLYEDDMDPSKTEYDTLDLTWNLADHVLSVQNGDGSWNNPAPSGEGSRSANSVMFTASALMALAPYTAPLAPPETVSISGQVLDPLQQTLQDAKVEALLGNNVVDYTVTTGSGFYQLSVPEGYAYTVRVSAAGYARRSAATQDLTDDLTEFDMAFENADIDDVPPTITDLNPVEGSVLTETRFEISAVVSDDHAGVDPDTIVFTLNGSRVNAAYDPNTGKVSFFPIADLANNTRYTVTLDVKDHAQNAAVQAVWSFDVGEVTAVPGDVNGDLEVDLADAIMALQVAAGLYAAGVDPAADVNGDGRIGLAEAIYALGSIGNVR